MCWSLETASIGIGALASGWYYAANETQRAHDFSLFQTRATLYVEEVTSARLKMKLGQASLST